MESPEYKTLNNCYSTLVSSIQQSPSSIADHLRPFGVLAPEDLAFLDNCHYHNDQKARKIVDAILLQVQRDPLTVFQSFIGVLEAAHWTKTVITKLKKEYRSHSGSVSFPETESTSHVDTVAHKQDSNSKWIKVDKRISIRSVSLVTATVVLLLSFFFYLGLIVAGSIEPSNPKPDNSVHSKPDTGQAIKKQPPEGNTDVLIGGAQRNLPYKDMEAKDEVHTVLNGIGQIMKLVHEATGASGTVAIQGRSLQYKVKGGIYMWKYQFTGEAWDKVTGTRVITRGWENAEGAKEHALEDLVAKLKELGHLK